MNKDNHIKVSDNGTVSNNIQVVDRLDVKNNWLTSWDIESTPCVYQDRGELKNTEFSILLASDTKEPIGKPFNPNTYSPISNKQLLELVEEVLDNSKSELVKIGSFRNRARIYASLRVKDYDRYTIGKRDFRDYLNFGNAFDQSSTLWCNNSNLCIQCQNSFNYNMHECNTGVKIIHKGNIENKMFDAKILINNFLQSQQMFIKKFTELNQTPITKKSAESLITGFVLRNDKKDSISKIRLDKINRIYALFENGGGNTGETAADVFSAITDFYTHESVRRGDENMQYYSSEIGLANKEKNDFWRVINDGYMVENMIHLGELKRAA